MLHIRLLPLLLLLVYPLYTRGDGSLGSESRTEDDEKKDPVYEKLNSMDPTETEHVEAMIDIFQGQHDSLASRLTGDKHKIKQCLTDCIDAVEMSSVTETGKAFGLAFFHEVEKALALQKTTKDCCNCSQPENEDDENELINDKPGAKPASCAEIDGGKASGVYQIYPNKTFNVSVRCVNVHGGGWTVIQARLNGKVDFYQGWDDYAKGFGDPAGEYWLGLHHINALTAGQHMELYVSLEDFDRGPLYAKYSGFYVSPEKYKFRLHVSGYSGTAGDALVYHNLQSFSTKDWDNDQYTKSCSIESHGAWWYKDCHASNLNGHFTAVKAHGRKYMDWDDKYGDKAMEASMMMIRPSNFKP